ncbi:MBL fold metallo-hydrolase [Aggregatilinea lenta]|uniref:MBL fold metallo-hydrolase n=1 Tax=Aggregatilinea lenta TaxID=913108 RepID=UPI000E5BBBC4|nr:MBL fold metallo-hydrolase [Aggregatilinea lenta]
MIHIGNIEVHAVSAGQVMVDGGGPFGLVPRALWSRILAPDEANRVPMSLTCLLVRAARRTILIDTGLGDKLSEKEIAHWGLTYPEGTLAEGLARLGVTPGDVDMVINTHLHADHCAGNTCIGPDGALQATFPNAEYVVQAREYADAMHPNERTRATYFPANYEPLVQRGRMRLLDGDTEIVPGIWGVVTPGHTPGHQAIRFESGGQQALFVADLASYTVHFERLAWMTAYDVEPLVTLETKRRWQQWALDTSGLLIFQHDTQVPAGHLVRTDQGKLKVTPAAL